MAGRATVAGRRPLKASDFRRGIERLFRVHSPGASYFAGIIGAAACARLPASRDLSRGIVTDDATSTVVFHLTTPDPQFLFNLTRQGFSAPVPPGTPDHETGSHTVPGTGPYKITTVTGTQVRFVRNPFFREWSHAAQPDSIVWRIVPAAQDAVTAIEHTRAASPAQPGHANAHRIGHLSTRQSRKSAAAAFPSNRGHFDLS